MNHKETLRPYIKAQIQSGTPTETIKQHLIQLGWPENIVDEVLAEETTPVMPPNPSATVQQPMQTDTHETVVSEAKTIASEHYTVRQAIKDAFEAIRNNGLAVGAMLLIGFTVSSAVTALLVIIFAVSVFGSVLTAFAFHTAGVGILQLIATVILLVVLAIVVSTFASAFSTSIISLAVNDGADNKTSDLKQTLSAGLKRTLHVGLAMLFTTLIVMAPVLIVALIGGLSMILSAQLGFIIMAIGTLIALPVIFVVALRLTLVPIVSVFEPEVPLRKLYGRTQHLMSAGGVWFVIKLMAILIVVDIILQMLLPHGSNATKGFSALSVLSILAVAFASLLYSAVLVLFYRNRKAVRG